MKAILAVLVFSLPLFAQNENAVAAKACGDFKAKLSVELDHSQHAVAPPDAGKARIYFLHDAGIVSTLGYPNVMMGADGQWVGANKKDTYFSILVEPGMHHLCAVYRFTPYASGRDVELASLTAEAGKVYFYRTRVIAYGAGPDYLDFMPVDREEGEYLISSYSLATAHPAR